MVEKNFIGYSSEKNVQILIYLLKAHSIKYVIASPGTANAAFVMSVQNDRFFTVYSAIDERSAAYMACGLAVETGEPVVISCTGATAGCNYFAGLTEAYYSKLPIIAINSVRPISKIGNLIPQVNDLSTLKNDIACLAVNLPVVKDEEDIWECEVKINRALLEVKSSVKGPVHIVLPSIFSAEFIPILPSYRAIFRIFTGDIFPPLEGRIAVFIGSQKYLNNADKESLERFAIANNAPIFCEHISNYTGKNKILYPLAASQDYFNKQKWQPDIMIHIGEISGSYAGLFLVGKKVWRVNKDGKLQDTFRKLTYIFEMSEKSFFEYYTIHKTTDDYNYYAYCDNYLTQIKSNIPALPFSNIWVASTLAPVIPQNSIIHFGILNTMRAWNFFTIDSTINVFSNVGGFGIDGCLSTFIGASLVHPGQLYFCFLGDLAFFYDMNVLGNRHITNNIRIMIINNGLGMEFKNYNHHASIFNEDADKYIAAKGHFGNKSPNIVKHYAEDLGFTYLSASNKIEFNKSYEQFLNPNLTKNPILFEVFIEEEKENLALKLIQSIDKSMDGNAENGTKKNSLRYQ